MENQVQQEAKEEEKEDIALVEAALYVSGRPLDLKTIGSVLGTRSYKRVKAAARALAEKYANLKGALEILELQDERFVMQLKNRVSAKRKTPLNSTTPHESNLADTGVYSL